MSSSRGNGEHHPCGSPRLPALILAGGQAYSSVQLCVTNQSGTQRSAEESQRDTENNSSV